MCKQSIISLELRNIQAPENIVYVNHAAFKKEITLFLTVS